MAIEWCDNFDVYGGVAARMLDGIYSDVGFTTIAADPDGVSAYDVAYPSQLNRVLSGNLASVGVAFWVYFETLPDNVEPECLLSINASNNQTQVNIRANSTGKIYARRGTNSVSGSPGETAIAESASPVFVSGTWHHVEVYAVYSNSAAGSVEVRVDATTVINATGVSTSNTSTAGGNFAQLRFASSDAADGPSSDYALKHVVVWNTNGTQNNTFLGMVEVAVITPDGDDTFSGWTTSSGSTGYNLIDDVASGGAISDADYIQAGSTPPAAAIFTMSNLNPDVVTVKGIQTVFRAKKSDGGTSNVRASLSSAGSDDDGDAHASSVNFTNHLDLSEVSPATGVAYTPAAVNAIKLKLLRTA